MGTNRSQLVNQQSNDVIYNLTTMDLDPATDAYICVDVETAGPIPLDFSMLSIGACTLLQPQKTFYVELKPVNQNITGEAASIHKLSLEHLLLEGIEPRVAMTRFEEWLINEAAPNQQPLFLAFNAAFDWMFINYYFQHYLGRNPFGHTAIDIKAFYMGMAGVPWSQTSWRFITPQYMRENHLTHHALQDALDQAELFKLLLDENQRRKITQGENYT